VVDRRTNQPSRPAARAAKRQLATEGNGMLVGKRLRVVCEVLSEVICNEL
jgi:hypothetical protein